MTEFGSESGGDSSGDATSTDMEGDLESSDMGGENSQEHDQSTDMQGIDNTGQQSTTSEGGDEDSDDQNDGNAETDLESELEPGESEEEEEEVEGEEEETGEERKPYNSEYANSTYTFEEGTELQAKYPEGVQFDAEGYPDFSSYATEIVEIDMKGNHTTDYQQANEAAGLDRTPEGFTWHHHQDGKTMLLVPSDIHSAVRHTGGVSTIRHGHQTS